MLPYVSLGPYLLQLPGLALLAGVWIAISIAEKEALRMNFVKDQIYNLAFVGLVAGVVGARLAYAARYFSIYMEDPLSLVSLNTQTLSASGGLAIGLLAAGFVAYRKKMDLQKTLDAFAPGLVVFMAFFALAHLLSGDAFGSSTEVPWAVYLWDDYRHPVQIYEMTLAVGIYLIVRKHPLGESGDGRNFLLSVALLAVSRLFLEAFRGDSVIVAGGLRSAQLASLAIALLSFWLIRRVAVSTQVEDR